MASIKKTLSSLYCQFFNSSKSGGIALIFCTLISLALANSIWSSSYTDFWNIKIVGMSIEHWVNDGLMAVFFLLIGLELEREFYIGELSNFSNALLPIVAAIGGIIFPALIHFTFNAGSDTQAGIGIPMATDIAFALGVLALLGTRIPASLKVFLTALAVMDDLGAIIVIALFYTTNFSLFYLLAALTIFGLLIIMNRRLRIMILTPYLIGGAMMWFFMMKSGVHATIAGVILAFAIPFSAKIYDKESPSYRLENILHKPVVFIILPVFALANTGIIIDRNWTDNLVTANSLGIMAGLLLGKPLGIMLLCVLAVKAGLCKLPADLNWKHIFGAGMLGGIGFTMSIFITNLAFLASPDSVTESKISVLLASLVAGVIGFLWLRFSAEK